MRTCRSAKQWSPPKGLNRKARTEKIADFTGVSAPYEVPAALDLVIPTGSSDVVASLTAAVAYGEAPFAL